MSGQEPTASESLRSTLGIAVCESSRDRVVACMQVGPKLHQSTGPLHGGASVALAEAVASLGGTLHVDQSTESVVGLEINASHLRTKRDGMATAVAAPLYIGRRTQVWDIRITDESDNLICVSRCTLAVVPSRRPATVKAYTSYGPTLQRPIEECVNLPQCEGIESLNQREVT